MYSRTGQDRSNQSFPVSKRMQFSFYRGFPTRCRISRKASCKPLMSSVLAANWIFAVPAVPFSLYPGFFLFAGLFAHLDNRILSDSRETTPRNTLCRRLSALLTRSGCWRALCLLFCLFVSVHLLLNSTPDGASSSSMPMTAECVTSPRNGFSTPGDFPVAADKPALCFKTAHPVRTHAPIA